MSFIRKEEGTHVFSKVVAQRELSLSNEGTVTKTTAYTVTAADSGLIIKVTGTTTITLPATALGIKVRIFNANADGVAITVSPNSADKIVGNGFTAADDKDAINTAATAKYGDFIDLLGDGVDGWYIQSIKGTWARQA